MNGSKRTAAETTDRLRENSTSEQPPNIVLVSMDSLRGDHCGFLGNRRGLTPAMDELAAEGVNYRTAVAPGPQTFSSMPAVFTGQPRPVEDLRRYSGETHWQRRIAAINDHMRTTPSFPELLRELGYTTAAVTPNPWTSSPTGFDRGFDRFEDLSSERADDRIPSLLERLPGIDTDDRAVKLAVDLLTGSSFFSRWDDLYGSVSQLRSELSEPYFLWVFLLDTHYPFLTARSHREEQSLLEMYLTAYRSEGLMRGREEDDRMSPSLRQSVLAGYRDTVRASDIFLEQLRNDGDDDPVLIAHSDHGESFGEHGNYGHHHRDLYEENIHVPYIVHNAGVSGDVTDPISLSTLPDVVLDIGRHGTFDPEAHTAEFAVSRSECGTSRAVRGRRFKYFDSGSLASGDAVDRFEDEFAAFCGAEYGVATSNGTTALHAALEALGIGDGDRVLTTPFTFVATANAVRFTGAEPVFADIDPETYNLDPAKARARIEELDGEVDAILAVHLYGLPAAMEELKELAERYDVPLIEDAAQAHGATYRGEPVGSLGDVACFSFYPTKNMTTGEGGMIVTDDAGVTQRARQFINHGRSDQYAHERVGHNFRLTDIAAAIGRIQLQRLPAFVDARQQHAALLREELSESSFVLPKPTPESTHAYHQFTIRSDRRDELRDHLDEFGIDTGVYYPTPVHEQPAYHDVSTSAPVAERVASEVLSVPVHPQLSTRDVKTVIAALEYFDSYL